MIRCRPYNPKAKGKVERSHRVLRQKINYDLPNIFSQFQGFQGFFLNFLAVFLGFLVNVLSVFKILLKKFIRSLLTHYRFRNFRTNLNIRRFSDTKMGDLSRFDNFSVINSHFKVFQATWSDFKVLNDTKTSWGKLCNKLTPIYEMFFVLIHFNCKHLFINQII